MGAAVMQRGARAMVDFMKVPARRASTHAALLLLATLAGCGQRLSPEVEGSGASAATGAGSSETPTGESSAGETQASPSATGDSDPSSTSMSGSSEENETETESSPGLGEPCDFREQNCVEGQKCAPLPDDADEDGYINRCVLRTGDKQRGEPCTFIGGLEDYDDCDLGHLCWSIEAQGPGACVAQSSNELPDGCLPTELNTAAFGLAVVVCLPACDPRVDGCPDPLECWFSSEDFRCDWLPQQSLGEGEACADDDSGECNPGLYCAPGSALLGCEFDRCCTPYCTTGEPEACAPGLQCNQLFDVGFAPEGLEDLGICIL